MTILARRSSLILPVNQPRFVERAYTRGADAIVLDLEDSVPAAEKGSARKLVKEGVLIVPSHMGERPIRAMHGYHPSEKQSYAALLTNQPEIPEHIQAIPDIYRLMRADAELAHTANTHADLDTPLVGIPEEELDLAF